MLRHAKFAFLVLSLLTVELLGAETDKPAAKKPAAPRKPDPSLAPIKDEPGLPRVLLIGDSISMGYTLPVRELLKGQANVHRIPTNGSHTATGVAKLDSWLGSQHWDVIHFNWGLHDLNQSTGVNQVPLEQYEKNLGELVKRLKASGTTLIWCSTTPVPEGVTPARRNSDVQAYNAVAKKIMDANSVTIDDLYAYAEPKLAVIQRPANVHFSPEGSKVLAEQVASTIRAALKTATP